MRVLPEAIDASNLVAARLAEKGQRAADNGISLPFLASMAAAAGDGDHVDIGSLFGASALAVALTKKELGLEGDIYCIDPYDADKRATQANAPDNLGSNLSGTEKELLENAKDFDVELKLVKAESHPWPEELKDNVFASAYVDGDHRGEAPLNDFKNLRGRVTGYIGTDNFEEEYPDVVAAVLEVADYDDWFLWYKNLIFVAVRRIIPMRSDPTMPDQQLAR